MSAIENIQKTHHCLKDTLDQLKKYDDKFGTTFYKNINSFGFSSADDVFTKNMNLTIKGNGPEDKSVSQIVDSIKKFYQDLQGQIINLKSGCGPEDASKINKEIKSMQNSLFKKFNEQSGEGRKRRRRRSKTRSKSRSKSKSGKGEIESKNIVDSITGEGRRRRRSSKKPGPTKPGPAKKHRSKSRRRSKSRGRGEISGQGPRKRSRSRTMEQDDNMYSFVPLNEMRRRRRSRSKSK